jgi:solute carrier family 10 (sodium/bile acid cotransporter), member 7
VPGSFERSGHLPSPHCSSCGGRGFRARRWSRGAEHWRLHAAITSATFILFPLLGFGLWEAAPHALPRSLWSGVLFVCVLPSTVQSSIALTSIALTSIALTSIALTSIARGNVAGTVCSAAGSNLAGLFLTPILFGLLSGVRASAISLAGIQQIVLQLLVPFVRGSANGRSATNQF